MICVVTFSVIYGCNFFMGLCYLGLMALPSLLQLGVCLIWVYAVLRNLTVLVSVFLAVYSLSLCMSTK